MNRIANYDTELTRFAGLRRIIEQTSNAEVLDD